MRARLVERMLWAAAVASGIVAVVGWRSAVRGAPAASPRLVATVASPAAPPPDAVERAGARLVDVDPFRAARHPSPMAYRPDVEGAPPPPPRPPRPTLLLTGIIGGPPWQAVLEGIPGQEGSVVARRGDVFGQLVVRAVRRDTVIVSGMDTTWKLTVRTAW